MPTLKIPNGEIYCAVHGLRPWKGPAHLQASVGRVSQFLDRHPPH